MTTETNNISDVIWDALCTLEDGNAVEAHKMVAPLNDASKALFEDEADRMMAKADRAAAYDVKDNDFDARNIGADSPFERVILDSQEMANG